MNCTKVATGWLFCCFISIMAACAGNHAAQGGSGSGSYLDRYNHGEYAAAKAEAESVYKSSTGSAREHAALIAGLSSQSLNQTADAKRYLRPLLASQDRDISGKAGAALGIIARKEADPANAAKLLSEAATKLTGDDAARAALFAGDAYKSMNRTEAARAQYAAALQYATTDTLKADIQAHLSDKRYTVQVGVFANRTNADKKVNEVLPKAQRLGIGPVKVVPASRAGKQTYMVQIGEFNLKQNAVAALAKLGDGTVTTIE